MVRASAPVTSHWWVPRRPAGTISPRLFGDPVIATFLEFLLQGGECGPVGLISFAIGLHRAIVRLGEGILRFLTGALYRARQFTAVAAVPVGLQNRASFCCG
jgi:hypothetical protein